MKKNEGNIKARRVRGIYLLPNLLTIAAMFAGFYAIVAAMNGYYENTAIAILVAVVMDGLDGRVARLTHSQSDFGAQLDSLSDMVSFGISPALVVYTWSIAVLGKVGWLAAFLYAVCAALRLARFNTQLNVVDKRYFQGLSTTAAAIFIASIVWVCSVNHLDGQRLAPIMLVITFLVGLLQVSTIRYRSFKDLDLRNRVPFVVIIAVVVILVLIAFDPSDIIFVLISLFVLSGPVSAVWRWCVRRRQLSRERRQEQADDDE